MTPAELAEMWEAEAAARNNDDFAAVRLRSCAAQLRAVSGGKSAAKVTGDVLQFLIACALVAYIVYVFAGGH